MLSRFTKINGVGKFINCNNLGGKHFSKNTLIYGNNTGGKTTLTDIFWSLKTGDRNYIESRKTFGFSGSQSIELVFDDGKKINFPSEEWNNGIENIEIFDNQFINNNVFDGDEVSYDQQKNLHTIIIGKIGKELSNKIDSLQNNIKDFTDKKTERTKYFKNHFPETEYNDFIKLPKYSNLDKEIEGLQNRISISKNLSEIKSIFDKQFQILESIINQDTKIKLNESIDANVTEIEEHIKKTWKNPNHSKSFLNTGLQLTKDDKEFCVFCGNKMDEHSHTLLDIYSKYFSEKYNNLQNDVISILNKFEKFNPTQIIETIVDKLKNYTIVFSHNANIEIVEKLRLSFIEELSNKKENLNYKINFSDLDKIIDAFTEIYENLKTIYDKFDFEKGENIIELNKEILKYQNAKARHNEVWAKFIDEGLQIEEKQEILKKERDKLRKDLEMYCNDLYENNFFHINYILKELGADFRICEPAPLKKLTGKSERIFVLEFFESHKINLIENELNKPRFKNTLSESDKRLLSFAFFYSLLMNDSNLDEKIVVFDDPFSSFDKNRRNKTVQLLVNPYLINKQEQKTPKKFNQLIILTHEDEFFKWLFKNISEPKTLKIVDDGIENGIKKSSISDCNAYEEFIEDEIRKNLKFIKRKYSENKPITNYDGIADKCRKILENIFTKKYYFELEELINKRKSVRSFVTFLKENKINEFDKNPKYQDFILLCDSLNVELHDNSLKNEGQNAITVLGDFLKLIKDI